MENFWFYHKQIVDSREFMRNLKMKKYILYTQCVQYIEKQIARRKEFTI